MAIEKPKYQDLLSELVALIENTKTELVKHVLLIPLKDQNVRDFYGKIAYNNLFGVRDLRKNIKQKVFERTEHANLQIIESGKIEKGIFKDPTFPLQPNPTLQP